VNAKRVTAAALPLLFLLASCQGFEQVPETGRTRPKLRYTEQEMAVLGAEAYEETTSGHPVVQDVPQAAMLEEVGRRIAEASGRDYAWEFRLLEAPDVQNAFCLPGGKIAVYSGMFEVLEDADDLAVILGHEVAHATLQHANERMSEPRLKRLITLPVRLVTGIWGAIAPKSRELVMGAFGLGYVVGRFMPYSQEHEHEADEIGLRYMHAAGFDVSAAPKLWERIAEASPRDDDPLSTHPHPQARAERLRRIIAERYATHPAPEGAQNR
jgi:predicted Zn-dependent protease